MATLPHITFDHLTVIAPYIGDGNTQMDIDAKMLQWVSTQSQTHLIMRCYVWQPQTVSIGVHQKHTPELNAIIADNPWVKRPTGGRAILHGNDVSYAFATNHPQLLTLPVKASYCLFLDWIKSALLQLGVPLKQEECSQTQAYQFSTECFSTITPQDLFDTDGNKLGGSAQLKQKHELLQHGALFIEPYLNQSAQELLPLFNTALVNTLKVQHQKGTNTLSFMPDFLMQDKENG